MFEHICYTKCNRRSFFFFVFFLLFLFSCTAEPWWDNSAAITGALGSRGPQHFSFRPGLSSAHCQHQDERTLMRHRGELPGKGRPLPKSTRFRQNRLACFLKSHGLSLAHFHHAGCTWLHERSGLLNRHCTCVSVDFRQETGLFQSYSFLKVTSTGGSVFSPLHQLKVYFIQMPGLQRVKPLHL